MKRKLGAITIGQSPRMDVIPEMEEIFGDNIEVLQAGALDGLTKEDVAKFIPQKDDYILVSKLRDGTSVKFGESHILPRLQGCIDTLEEKGVEVILFVCTGQFPPIFKTNKPILYPKNIIHSVVPGLASNKRIGVMNPDKAQLKQCLEKWGESGCSVEATAASPYGDPQEIIDAANSLKGKDIDLIVMDCMGYTVKMKNIVREITGKPVILSRTITARVVREMLD